MRSLLEMAFDSARSDKETVYLAAARSALEQLVATHRQSRRHVVVYLLAACSIDAQVVRRDVNVGGSDQVSGVLALWSPLASRKMSGAGNATQQEGAYAMQIGGGGGLLAFVTFVLFPQWLNAALGLEAPIYFGLGDSALGVGGVVALLSGVSCSNCMTDIEKASRRDSFVEGLHD